ncbi:MAG: DUF4317 domain-containing protein [Eubacterium sp.]|nr:DUF4317 domain-containing protein [Eubacterium sp.]
MNRKEINEIKALYDTIQDCSILRLAGCYVNGERNKVKTFNESFYNLPEEEMYKYLEIFRKTLSGTPGKNLLDMSFTDQSMSDETYGRAMLDKLRRSELKDDEVLQSFYDKVIGNYDCVGNYLILLIYQSYDVPGMTTDGIEVDDASEEVYNYILCSICPMKLTKPGLGFDEAVGEIHTLRQIFAVELPETGFIFPAFNDRSSDDSMLLYSTRKTDHIQDMFLEKLLGVSTTLPAKQQKEGFTEFVSDILGNDSSFETVLAVQENLSEAVRNKKTEFSGETVFLDKDAVRNVFENSGVPEEKLKDFSQKFDDQFDMKKVYKKNIESVSDSDEADAPIREQHVPSIKVEEKLFADNVVPVRNFEVKTKDMVLRINSKHTDIIDTRVIDGKKCLVIELTDDLTVNGIPVGGDS